MRKVNATLTVIMVLALMAGTASAVSYFPLDNTAYIIQGDTDQSYLTTINLSTSPWKFNQILPTPTTAWPVRINNLGFRVVGTGGLLYATQWNGIDNEDAALITIDADGNKNVLTTTGAQLLPNMNSGDVSSDGKYMYLTNSGGAGTGSINDLYVVNLNTLNVTRTNIDPFTGRVNDFAYNPIDGYLYGGNQSNGYITRLNPDTGERTDLGSSPILPTTTGVAYGGAWFGLDGTLYLYENNFYGGIYPVTFPGGVPTLGTFIDGPNSVDVDAAAYPIPEPASMLLFGSGLMGAAAVIRRRFKR